jgi:conserved uncharacterized protein
MILLDNVNKIKKNGWWYDTSSEEYISAIRDLDIDPNSTIGQFYSHAEDGPTFTSKGVVLYHICWFLLFSTYELDILRASDGLGLPKEFIPLDSFEGEVGFFYNKQSEEVFQFSLNRSPENTMQLTTIAKWDTFNLFLDWYL